MTTQYDIVGVTFSSLLTLCAEGKQRVGVLLGRRQQHDRFTIDDASETSRQAKEIVEVQGIYELGPSFVPLLTDIGTVAPSFDELIPTELHPQILGWFTCRSASTSAPSINEIWFHAALGNKFSSSDMIGCITNYSVRDHRGHVGMDCTVYTRPEGSRVLVPVPFNVTSHVIGETVHHVTSQDQETGESDLGTIDTSDTHRTLDSRLPPIMFPEALAQAARETEAHGDAVLGAIKQLLLEIQEEEAHIHQCLKPAA
eukprot:m.64235 g.64235  ORF g.64235 m.64235 type:complete len:256 (-) comp11993_c0_seq1:253-1020(-)